MFASPSHRIAHFLHRPMPRWQSQRRRYDFDTEFGQDAFDVLTDRPGTSAEDQADLIVRFTLCDPGQNPPLRAGFPPASSWRTAALRLAADLSGGRAR